MLRLGLFFAIASLYSIEQIAISQGNVVDLSDRKEPVILIDALSGVGDLFLGTHSLIIQNARAGHFYGAISGEGGIEKSGAPTLTLSGVSSYWGPTVISKGAVA